MRLFRTSVSCFGIGSMHGTTFKYNHLTMTWIFPFPPIRQDRKEGFSNSMHMWNCCTFLWCNNKPQTTKIAISKLVRKKSFKWFATRSSSRIRVKRRNWTKKRRWKLQKNETFNWNNYLSTTSKIANKHSELQSIYFNWNCYNVWCTVCATLCQIHDPLEWRQCN